MKYAILILIMILCAGKTVLANEDGYIIQADVSDERLVCVSEKNIISEELGIYRVDSEAELSEFCENYSVEKVEPDCRLELFDVPDDAYYSQRWDASEMKLPDVWDYDLKPGNINVAVLDTGIDTGHEDFDYERIDLMHNFCAIRAIQKNGGDITSPENEEKIMNVEDDNGHGTAVAGVIAAKRNNALGVYGVASGVNLNIFKVFSSDCSDASCIVAALADIYEEHPEIDVINVSIGFSVGGIVQDVINKLAERGVIVVAAVGNEGAEAIKYPAGCDNVIGVGALSSTLEVAYYSQHNTSVDVAAPGTGIYTTWYGNSYQRMNGTSFASPYVAAVAALVKAVDGDIGHDGFMELIKKTSQDKGNEGYDTYYGWGVLNPAKLMDMLADSYGLMFTDESGVVSAVQTTDTSTVYTAKRRWRDFEAYAVSYDESGVISRVQKRYVARGEGECLVEFEGAPDMVFWWDSKMQPLFGK